LLFPFFIPQARHNDRNTSTARTGEVSKTFAPCSRASLRRTSCATRVVAKSLIVALSAEWEGSLMRQEALKDHAIEIVDDIAIGV